MDPFFEITLLKLLKKGIKTIERKNKRISLRKYINDVKNSGICLDCKLTAHDVKLTFDHRNWKLKKFNVADGCRQSLKKVKLEIEKCDLVCRACHQIREDRRDLLYGKHFRKK